MAGGAVEALALAPAPESPSWEDEGGPAAGAQGLTEGVAPVA